MDINRLSLEQKIGQMFLVSLDGTELSQKCEAHYQEHCIGNFIYFAKNLTGYKDIRALSDSLQTLAKGISGVPAFISIDQEGGNVVRALSGTTHFPSNMAVVASGASVEVVEQMGEMVGESLKRLGININHAPTVDVNNNPKNPVIGIRSYSDDPAVVCEMASAYIRGLQNGGVIATAKHFPGHGDTEVDSHIGLPSVSHGMDRLNAVELAPFRAAIKNGVDSIMTTHILFKAIDKDVPATLSREVITGLLRGEMGYEGIVITDCMSMEAIKTYYTMEKGCVMAINAGVDMLCMFTDNETQARCIRLVHEAVNSGEIPIERIDAAVTRILKYKKKYACGEAAPMPLESYAAHEALADEISDKSTTLLWDKKKLLPLTGKGVFVLSAQPYRARGPEGTNISFTSFTENAAKALGCKYAVIKPDLNEDEADDAANQAAGCDVVLYATRNAIHNPGQVRLFEKLKAAGKKVVLVTMGVPYDIQLMSSADACIATYDYTNRAVGSAVNAIVGKSGFSGKVPVGL